MVTVAYMALTYAWPERAILGIGSSAAGIFGVPVNFFVTWLVSRLGPPPPAETQALIDQLRQP
jgi:cation/acetate symporter